MAPDMKREDDKAREHSDELLFDLQTLVQSLKQSFVIEQQATKDKLDRLSCDINLIKEVLLGGSNPDRSLYVRVDRMEQNAKKSQWAIRLLFGACIAAVAAAIQGRFLK